VTLHAVHKLTDTPASDKSFPSDHSPFPSPRFFRRLFEAGRRGGPARWRPRSSLWAGLVGVHYRVISSPARSWLFSAWATRLAENNFRGLDKVREHLRRRSAASPLYDRHHFGRRGGTRLCGLPQKESQAVEAIIGDRSHPADDLTPAPPGFPAGPRSSSPPARARRTRSRPADAAAGGEPDPEPCRRDTAGRPIGFACCRRRAAIPMRPSSSSIRRLHSGRPRNTCRIINLAGDWRPRGRERRAHRPHAELSETGYGYIKTGPLVAKLRDGAGRRRTDFVFEVEKFVEKGPILKTAREYLAHAATSGIRRSSSAASARFLKLFDRYLPRTRPLFPDVGAFGPRRKTALAACSRNFSP